MVSSVFSLLNHEVPGTFSVATLKASAYFPADSSHSHAGDELYPDFGANIEKGVVWFWLLEQWRDLPKELWAWKHVTVSTVGHYFHGRYIWVPSLLLFDFWEYRDNPIQFLDSRGMTSVINRQPAPCTTAPIASRLFEIFRVSGNLKMGRTCRLVCRDWANACSVREPNYWKVEDGVVWHWVETAWRVLPTRLWAWALRPFSGEWWVERRCHRQWFPRLLQPVSSESFDYANHLLNLSSPSSMSDTSKQDSVLIAWTLPPELIKRICDAADGESGSSRLVCQYWNRQCTPHVFRRIDVEDSPERIRALWKHRMDPIFTQYMKLVMNVPWYHSYPTLPWIHLLTQTCTSAQPESTWKQWASWGERSHIEFRGPFAGGHRTIRSVHFALPRSPPRSFSRGIKTLELNERVRFRRVHDLAHLASELPDLEVLECYQANIQEYAIELPHRRPRTNCNRLRECKINPNYSLEGYMCGAIGLAVYLSVYNAASFFSEAEIAHILALLQVKDTYYKCIAVCYSYNDRNHSRTLDFKYSGLGLLQTFLGLHISRHPIHIHPVFNIIVDCFHIHHDEDETGDEAKEDPKGCARYWQRWKQLDIEFRKISALIAPGQFVLGFEDRDELNYFVNTVSGEMIPTISGLATLRYGIYDVDAVETGYRYEDGNEGTIRGTWRQASPDSEELTGTPRCDLGKLYPC